MNVTRKRALAAALSAVAVGGGLVAFVIAPSANAAPSPAAPIAVYTENFENGVSNTPVLLTDYTGASGETYTADAPWLTACNGDVLSANTTAAGSVCSSSGDFARLQQIALALGEHQGESAVDAANNHVVAAYTENNPGAGRTEFQTDQDITLPASNSNGRFLTFSVDAAAENCYASGPQYQFSLESNGSSTPVGGVINPCAGSNATAPLVGTYTSNGSLLFHGASLGVSMVNENGSGVGNDAAFDNIEVLDATPSLSKSFNGPAKADQPDTLTFTITNTSELAAKSGFSFTDTLPSGMVVSANPNTSSDCGSPSVTAAAASGAVSVIGSLASGQASCTVTVDVTAPGGNYSNGSGNISSSEGINPPTQDATVTYDTPPTETVAGGTYFQGQTGATTSYSCGDQFGTVTSCTGTDGSGNSVANGAPINTATPGSTTVTVTGTNDAGQSTSTKVTNKVVPVVGVCRGTPLGVTLLGLTLAPGTSNPPTAPCVTDAKQVLNINIVITPAVPLLHVAGNSISVGALSSSTSNSPAGSASAFAQIPDIKINLLGHSLEITALTENASSTLSNCTDPAALVGHSTFGTFAVDGVISPNQHTDKPVSIAVPGVATVAFNQTSVSGNTVTQDAVHINVAGLVNIVLGEAVAGASCGS